MAYDMHALVTGGCGFIGSHLVDRLVGAGHRVTVLDDLSTGSRANLHAQAILVEGDVADDALVQPLVHHADIVFHLAAVASVSAYADDYARCHRTNVAGTAAIFTAAQSRAVPVIYASSAAVYGDNPDLPLSEHATPRPVSDYGRDKHRCEQLAMAAWEQHSTPSVGLRFFNVYGPRQNPSSPYSGVISKFTAQARAGKPLSVFGDGEQTRDFIYVSDIVDLLIASAKHLNAASIYNGCTGFALSINALAQAIAKQESFDSAIDHAPARSDDIRHSLGDPARALQGLDFKAKITFEHGLRALLASHA